MLHRQMYSVIYLYKREELSMRLYCRNKTLRAISFHSELRSMEHSDGLDGLPK